jgi:hypothetical protein
MYAGCSFSNSTQSQPPREGVLEKALRHALLEILVMTTMGTQVVWVRDSRGVELLAAPTASRYWVDGDRPPVIVIRVAHALVLSATVSNRQTQLCGYESAPLSRNWRNPLLHTPRCRMLQHSSRSGTVE